MELTAPCTHVMANGVHMKWRWECGYSVVWGSQTSASQNLMIPGESEQQYEATVNVQVGSNGLGKGKERWSGLSIGCGLGSHPYWWRLKKRTLKACIPQCKIVEVAVGAVRGSGYLVYTNRQADGSAIGFVSIGKQNMVEWVKKSRDYWLTKQNIS